MEPTLEIISAIARGAGDILRAGFNKSNQVELKGEIDLVTEVDQKSETYILAEIKNRFPDHKILAEEGGGYSLGVKAWNISGLYRTSSMTYDGTGVALGPIFSTSLSPAVFLSAFYLVGNVDYDSHENDMQDAEILVGKSFRWIHAGGGVRYSQNESSSGNVRSEYGPVVYAHSGVHARTVLEQQFDELRVSVEDRTA